MLSMDSVAVKHHQEDNLESRSEYATGTFFQLRTLIERLVVKTIKQPKTTFAGCLRNVIIGTFLGSIYYKQPTGTDSSSYTNRMALIFFSLLANFVSHQEVIPIMFHDRLLFYRERGAKAYGALPYWISSWIIRIPLCAINSALFCACVYNLTGLRAGGFSFFYLIITFHSFTSSFLCQFVANINPSAATAISNMSMFLFMNIMFAGYIIFIDDMAEFLGTWAPFVSFYRYSFQALVRNEFDDNSDLPLGSVYVDNMGFDSLDKETCFSILLVMLLFYATSGFLALRFINFEER